MANLHFTKNAFACLKNVCNLSDYNGFEQNRSFSAKHTVIYHWPDVSTNRTFKLSPEHDRFPNV